MANTLRFKRGLVSGIPTAALGEPLFTTDTFDLYIGNGTGNTRFQKYIASGTTSQLLRGDGSLLTMPIVLTSPSNGQVLKYDGTNWVNSADAGVTGSGTAGQVTYWGSSSTITGSNNLFWDATNNRLGVNTNAPYMPLQIGATPAASLQISLASIGSTYNSPSNSGNSLFHHLIIAGDTPTARGIFGTTRTRGSITSPTAVLSGDASVALMGLAFDGTTPQASAVIQFEAEANASAGSAPQLIAFVNGSTGAGRTTKMQLRSNGNLILQNGGTFTDNGIRLQVTGDGYFSGSVGIGTSGLTGRSLSVSKNITGQYIFSGGSYGVGVLVDGVVQSDEVGGATYFRSFAQTQAASFTASAVYHFEAVQGTFGAGSTVSNQVGFFARETLIGATNNFGFYGNIASGTGRWNLYMNGTAANYLNGNLGIGITAPTARVESVGVSGTTLIRATGADSNGNADIEIRSTGTTGASRLFFGDTAATSGSIIYNHASDAMLFSTAATTRATLDASGNLGLGVVPSGSVRLEVNGAARLGTGTATVGATTLEQTYSGDNVLGVISAYQGTGAMILGYGIKAKTSADAFISTFDNFTGRRAAFSINQGYFEFFNTSAVNTAKGTDVAATSLMRLHTTGNLVLGGTTSTDAGFRLDVNGTMRVSGAATFSSSVTAASFNGTTNNIFSTGGTERMRLDASGNLGLGVTPSAWNSLIRGFDFGSKGALYAVDDTNLINNAFNNSSGTWIYKAGNTLGASRYFQYNGAHQWFNAPSGTAGNAITFTQAMTLFATGNLAVGTTTDAGYRLDVNGTMRVSSANNTTALTVSVGSNASYNFAANSTSGYSATFNINDTALYIGHNSSNRDLRLQTNSTDRLNVKGSGQVRFVPLAAAPTTNVEAGDVYYDSTTNKLRCYNGTTWNDLF